MTTIVNNPPSSDNSNSGAPIGMIITLIALFVLAYLGLVYGLPALQRIKIGSPQINIPNKIDINVNQQDK
ncbi:hypothetical protein A3J15_01980 [Candidatus Roizmanbacteria bacterium RIFCSPLOWO2_02_FULL_38_10]|uniref:Uncharacterized protein n=1 Tax=Candidatus Roizmanbacteria bacterium RIFCSPLOWO2_02_FULL_38_10 TaxID=1802074 RepID=A0A1F7JN63_9BACT|nr:MAG: hypothetical protein A3J15_01980 [Candidatus Roizmanbacteria bacterium RIFCSPLOWO2_02_FULL_38_10]